MLYVLGSLKQISSGPRQLNLILRKSYVAFFKADTIKHFIVSEHHELLTVVMNRLSNPRLATESLDKIGRFNWDICLQDAVDVRRVTPARMPRSHEEILDKKQWVLVQRRSGGFEFDQSHQLYWYGKDPIIKWWDIENILPEYLTTLV